MTSTPGPWVLESSETYTVRASDEGAICQLKWLRGRHGSGGRRDDDEVMANACLIAAAPDMLAELKQCALEAEEAANLIAPNFPRAATLFQNAAIRTRAAIAKATEGR